MIVSRVNSVGTGHDPPVGNRRFPQLIAFGNVILLRKITGRVMTLPYRAYEIRKRNDHLPVNGCFCYGLDGLGEGSAGGGAGRLGAGQEGATEIGFTWGRIEFT